MITTISFTTMFKYLLFSFIAGFVLGFIIFVLIFRDYEEPDSNKKLVNVTKKQQK